MTETLELFTGGFWNDPYPAYTALRADRPVGVVHFPDGPMWMISRFADVRAALNDSRLSKDWRWTLPAEARAGFEPWPIPMMILMDPPEHTRLRKLVSRSFTLRRVQELRPRVAAMAAELIDALPESGTVDIIGRYAMLLPVRVICELLGVPLEDRERFTVWSNALVESASPDPANRTAQHADASGAASTALNEYLTELIARKRAEPDGALLSALVEVAEDGDRLSEPELVAMAFLLLVAGHETTVNLIANGLLALLTHPDQLALLRARPELLASAVEEFLRWDSPVATVLARFAAEDVEYSGVTIPAGSAVMVALAAANRDGARFDRPDELRIDRDAGGHLSFGHGVHHCLGAQLARGTGQVGIGMLVERRPTLALAVDPAELVYRRSTFVRGLSALPVDLGPA